MHHKLSFVTLREGEERGIYFAASKELVNIIEDRVREQGVEVLGGTKESARRTAWTVKALRSARLKNIDVGERRVVKNNRCAAEQA